MTRVLLLSVLALLAAAAPAAAHHDLTDAQRHRAADLAGVSVEKLERRVKTLARKLGRRPGTRTTARAAAVGDPDKVGTLVGGHPAPVVPIFSALLPSGKILMWDSVGDAPAESYSTHDFTRAAVYDPATNTSKRVDVPSYNIFCAGFVQLANGNVFVAGGNLNSSLAGIRQTHVFDWRTETWSRGPDMQDGRWYPSVASLPNDEALIIGGGPTVAEIRTTGNTIRRLTGRDHGLEPRVPVHPGDPGRPRAATRSGGRDVVDRRRPAPARSPPPATVTRPAAATAATPPTTSAASSSPAAAPHRLDRDRPSTPARARRSGRRRLDEVPRAASTI